MTDLDFVLANQIIAIVRGQKSEVMRPLAQALHRGGVRLIEVTFAQGDSARWRETRDAIRMLRDEFGGRVLPGAGTVLNPEQLRMAHEAGARYILSPNVDAALIRETKRLGLLSFPGALTPSEIVAAHSAGADIVKLFPAGDLGAGYIKAVRAPLPHIKLMAVGGVNERNAAEFVAAGCVGLGVGGNLVNKEAIEAGDWDRITASAKEYRKAVYGEWRES